VQTVIPEAVTENSKATCWEKRSGYLVDAERNQRNQGTAAGDQTAAGIAASTGRRDAQP
jgi:hypothetical protein